MAVLSVLSITPLVFKIQNRTGVHLEATTLSVYGRLLRHFRIATPMSPRRRYHAVVCVMSTEHRHLATKCTPRRRRFSCRLVHNEREDEIRRRAPLQRHQGIFSPSPHGGRHLVIRHRALVVSSKQDLIVELPEELERDPGDVEAANEVPRDEGIENLLCDVQSREVLHLELTFSSRHGPSAIRELVLRAHLASVELIFQEEAKVRGLVGRQLLVDREEILESIANDLET
jgi:hypothetical protein